MINVIRKVPLYNCNHELYVEAIFKNCFYNLLKPSCHSISFYDCYFDKKCTMEICNEYTSITNSDNCHLYYVVKNNDSDNIYIVNNRYQEIDKISLKVPNTYKGKIISIAFDKSKHKIFIALKDKLYSITIDGDFIKEEISRSSLEKISTKYVKNKIIRNLNGYCYNNTFCVYEPFLTAIGIFCNRVYLSYIKDGSLYLGQLSNNGNITNSFYIDDDIEVNAIMTVNKNLQLLITKHGKYNYIYITDYYCKDQKCDKNYCSICNKKDCDCDKECHRECHKECCDTCNVVESIALMETALAHVLNAEGEKIQKAICLSDDVCDLVKVNESVSRTIMNVALLEQILFSKLEVSITDCKNNCEKFKGN